MSIRRITKCAKDTSDGGSDVTSDTPPRWRKKERLKRLNSIFTLFLLAIILFRLGSYLYAHPSSFHKFDPEAYERTYFGSTYAQKGGAPISDYIVYGWAAWEYVHGKNPTLINPEMPPLGKYLMGLSILFFKRIAVGSLIFGFLSLVLVFLIGKIILKSTTFSLIPVALLACEPLFVGQLDTALLETYHLFFILLAFYFFLLAQEKPSRVNSSQMRYYLLASLALGGVIAVKFYSTGVIIVISWLVYLVSAKNYAGAIKLLISLPLALFVLLAAYFKIFLEGETLRRFFGIQKWMFHFHSSGKFLVPPGAIWQLIFLRKWITWWADRRPLPAPDWQITWPISVVFSLGLEVLYLYEFRTSVKTPPRCPKDSSDGEGFTGNFTSEESLRATIRGGKRQKCETRNLIKSLKDTSASILLIWIAVYLASLSFGIVYPRYLLPLLPFSFILSTLALKMLFSKATHKAIL